jgi:hypothetical protein
MRWLSIAATLGALACTSDEGNGSGGAGDGGSSPQGAGGAATWGESGCGTCVRDACATQIDACLADPECPGYLQCLEACPVTDAGDADPACQAGCPRGTGTESQRATAALDACRDPGPGAGCEACGIPDRAQVPDLPELQQSCPDSADPNVCFACQDESCCESIAACSAEPDCVAYKDCLRAYTGENPYYDCAIDHPAATAVFAPGFVCAEYLCAITSDPSDLCETSGRDACDTCLYDVCGKEWASLLRFPDGFLLRWCIFGCAVGDAACDEACYDLYPSARDEALQLAECLLAGCSGIC